MKSENTRFAHTQNLPVELSRYNGITIAYFRDDNYVYFGYAKCYHKDEYTKSVGRTQSLDRLDNLNPETITDGVLPGGLVGVDTVNQYGYASLEYFKDIVSNVVSDNVMDDMTMYSFKHAFISGVLREIVLPAILDHDIENGKA